MHRPGCERTAGRIPDVSGLGRRQGAAFRRENLGFIFQDVNLIPVLTVYENIEYPLLMVREAPARHRSERVLTLLRAVGMSEQRDKYPDQISGGQKQRVAVARALVTSPRLVLADEPTANLDHATAYQVIELMKQMRDSFGTTFLFSSHDPKIVGEAEIVHTLEDGRLAGTRTKGEAGHFVERGHETLLASGDLGLLQQVENLSPGGYGRMNLTQDYRYVRESQKEPCEILYPRQRRGRSQTSTTDALPSHRRSSIPASPTSSCASRLRFCTGVGSANSAKNKTITGPN